MKLKNRFTNTFLLALILGLATHMYRLTNWMLCNDSLNYLDSISPSWTLSLGRFLLPTVENVRGGYELSWLIGLLCIIYLSITAGIIASMFRVDGTIKRLIVAWVVVANPVVTSTFAYMYTADGYFFGLMLGTLFAYLINRKKEKKYLALGILALSASMAFYQGFLTTVIMLIVIELIMMLLDNNSTFKDALMAGVKNLVCGAAGMAIYYIGMNIAWKLTDTGLIPYMGLGEAPENGLIRYWYELKDCYVDFARVMLVRWKITSYNVMNVILILLVIASIIIVLTKKKLWKKPSKWISIGIIMLLIPVFTHIFEFLSENASYTTTIMDYGTMMVFLIPVVLFNNFDIGRGVFSEWTNKEYVKKHIFWGLNAILLLMICFNFTVIANKAYYNMFVANKNEELLANRMEMRLEQLDEYSEDMQIMIVGHKYQIPEYVTNAPMMSGVVSKRFISSSSEYISYMNKMLSMSYGRVPWDKQVEIAHTDEFMSMEVWPSKNSVKYIDGVAVIMLSHQNIEELYEDD